MLRLLLSLAALVAYSLACSCLEQTPQEAYCDADWVARVKVISIKELPVVNNNFYNIKHAVQHKQLFKKPSSLAILPSTVYGHAACPLGLSTGAEYLLAGRFSDGRLTTSLCGQVRPEVGNVWGPVLEWKQVPAGLPAEMRNFTCPSTPKPDTN